MCGAKGEVGGEAGAGAVRAIGGAGGEVAAGGFGRLRDGEGGLLHPRDAGWSERE